MSGVVTSSPSIDPIELAHENWRRAGWDDAADGMACVTSIMRVQQLLLARIDAVLRPFDLTFARFEVLMLLSFSSRGELPVGKIGERLQVHPASVTNAVKRLAVAGLVERTTNPHDARSVMARVTPHGRQLAAEAARVLNEAVFTDVGLDDRQQSDVFDLLAAWRAAHGDFS